MRSLNFVYYSSILIIVFFLLQCNGTLDPSFDSFNTIYATSFENESELVGWNGITIDNLRDDSPVNCGRKSVFISGGCVIPHASKTIFSPGTALKIQVEFYAKVLYGGGFFTVYMGNNFNDGHFISVQDSNWTFYNTEDVIVWSADSTLTIHLSAGGLKSGAMLVDALKIKTIN